MKKLIALCFTLVLSLSCQQPSGDNSSQGSETPENPQAAPLVTDVSRYFLADEDSLSAVMDQKGWLYVVPTNTELNFTALEGSVNATPTTGIKVPAEANSTVPLPISSLDYGDYRIVAVNEEEILSQASEVISFQEIISFDIVFTNGGDVPFGGSSGYKCYAFWLKGNSMQNLFICNNVRALSHSLLPYWETNVEPLSVDLDGVTAATHVDSTGSKNTDFTLSGQRLEDSSADRVTVYMEIARSWDRNDWFYSPSEQPALLYAVEVDLTSPVRNYEMRPIGWTPNSGNSDVQGTAIQGWAINSLNSEMRYITHHRDSQGNFGALDDTNSATLMVESIYIRF